MVRMHTVSHSFEINVNGAGPEVGHKDDQRAGVPLLRGQTKRVGAVQPGEEKAPG